MWNDADIGSGYRREYDQYSARQQLTYARLFEPEGSRCNNEQCCEYAEMVLWVDHRIFGR